MSVPGFLRRVRRDLPLVVGEAVPDVPHRDAVSRGDLLRDQERSRFEQLDDVHDVVVDHLPGRVVPALGDRVDGPAGRARVADNAVP
jgi:hypothetical protein